MTDYVPTIGLETHIQLNTKSKAFCSCRADSWNETPNTNICPVCTGQPGALPATNREMIHKALKLCIALHSRINPKSYFDRKNYLYADLPGGYQITQNDQPIGIGGWLEIDLPDGSTRAVHIDNIHMEEDAGKTKNGEGVRFIDFNRAGVPLLEIVTKPDLCSAEEAAAFLISLKRLVRWIDISEGNMEKAQLRCDANVSVAPTGSDTLGKKCELKNINSIEALRKAITFEISRQTRELEAGREVEQWTIEWDNDARELRKMRSKENAVDYRYFREPNLMPVVVDDAWITKARSEMPELPESRKQRFLSDYHLPQYDARILTGDRELADFFEQTLALVPEDPKKVSNWVMNEVIRLTNDQNTTADKLKLRPKDLAEIIRLVTKKQINTSTGKKLTDMVQQSGRTPAELIREQGLGVLSDETNLKEICAKIIAEHPAEHAAYQAGKVTLIGWFTGQVMRKTQGKADPAMVSRILKEML